MNHFYEMLTRNASTESKHKSFKVSTFGMSVLRHMMSTAGIMDWETDITDDDFPFVPDPEIDKKGYEEAADKIKNLLAIKSPNDGQVPATKFCSNDRWIVSKNECFIIAEAMALLLRGTQSSGFVLSDEDGNPYDPELMAKVLSLTKAWEEYNRAAGQFNGYIVD